MRERVEILINIEEPIISKLHETISSIIEQIAKDKFNIQVKFINSQNLDTSKEEQRLKNANISLNKNKTPRFTLILKAGEVISKSFLYKSIYYLMNNNDTSVCPEYTFNRLDNSLTVMTTYNSQMLISKTSANLIDHKKTIDQGSTSPRTNIVKDTCVVSNTPNTSLSEYIKRIKTEIPFFNFPLFRPIAIHKTKTPSPFSHKQSRSVGTALRRSLKKILIKYNFLKRHESATPIHNNTPPYLSDVMKNELEQLSNIKFSLKGYKSMRFVDVTYETFLNTEKLFEKYCIVANSLSYDDYSYVMVLPWLIHGGIDLFAINYLNTIAEINPNQHILVFLTNGTHRSFTKKEINLADNIELVDLPKLFKVDTEMPNYAISLIYSFINVFKPSHLHIMSSQTGYKCMEQYGKNIRDNGVKVIFSSYNYLIGSHGEYLGYAVQNLPYVYQPGDTITTDNIAYKNMCVNHYGFLEKDILVHRQLFDIDLNNIPTPTNKDGLRILWAAHVRPEKNPTIVPIIAKELKNDKVEIDCYGLFSPIHWENGKNPLNTNIGNLHYVGEYSNFFNDIDLQKYDLFLYTSHADGTPNVIIEAALAGLPIVSSRLGGIPDIIKDESVLVKNTYSSKEFVEKTKRVLSDLTNSRKKASTLQKELIRKHSKQNFTKQVKEMLERSKQ